MNLNDWNLLIGSVAIVAILVLLLGVYYGEPSFVQTDGKLDKDKYFNFACISLAVIFVVALVAYGVIPKLIKKL